MYALRDLMGHCYVHFAFVFTLMTMINERYIYDFNIITIVELYKVCFIVCFLDILLNDFISFVSLCDSG